MLLLCVSILSLQHKSQAQTETRQQYENMAFQLVGDTLFSNSDFKLYKNKKLLRGTGSGENGWYQYVSFKSPASWPLVIGREADLKYNAAYEADETIRDKDKVKEYLNLEDTLTITKIKRRGNKRSGYSYVLYLKQGQGIGSLNFRTWIAEALRTGELLLVDE